MRNNDHDSFTVTDKEPLETTEVPSHAQERIKRAAASILIQGGKVSTQEQQVMNSAVQSPGQFFEASLETQKQKDHIAVPLQQRVDAE